MLVLARKQFQSLVIFSPDGSFLGRVTNVTKIEANVKIGLEFPANYMIVREEVLTPDQQERVNAR